MKQRSWRAPALALLLLTGAACRKAEVLRDVVVDHADRPVGELVAGLRIEQSFVPNHDRLCAVAVSMATYGGRARGCRVIFSLRADGSKNVIDDHVVPCSGIADNAWLRFDFRPLEGTKGQRLILSVESPNGRPGSAATIWMATEPGIYPDGALSLNGVPTPGSLRFMTFHEQTE
jgi:hypothetical protein